MNKELETLKDIEIFEAIDTEEGAIADEDLIVEKLKKELGIKWINYLSTLEGTCGWVEEPDKEETAQQLHYGDFKILKDGQKYEDWEEASDITGAIKILIDLFNLKKEDFTEEEQDRLLKKLISFKEDLK